MSLGAVLLLSASLRNTLLFLLSQPNIAVLALLLGVLLIYIEANMPGRVIAGATGTLLVLLAVFGLKQQQLRVAALLLLFAGVGLLLLEAQGRAKGLAGLAGTLAIVMGLWKLVGSQPAVSAAVAVVGGGLFSLATVFLARIALQARRNKRTLASRADSGFLSAKYPEKPPFN